MGDQQLILSRTAESILEEIKNKQKIIAVWDERQERSGKRSNKHLIVT